MQICTERDDVLLTTAIGQCIRFPVADVRVFTGRTSMGVRGIALDNGDKVISLSILRHVDATSEERAAYLKRASAVRRGLDEDAPRRRSMPSPISTRPTGAIELGEQRYVELSAAEQFVLTISERGYGKRTSSFEYRTTGRGGKGIVAMDNRERDGTLRAKIGRLVGVVPGGGGRPAHAGHRRRPAHPLRASPKSASRAARPAASSCSTPPTTSAWSRSSG